MARSDEEVRDAEPDGCSGREEWYRTLEGEKIPAVSKENILNTFGQLHLNRGEVFERGVINVFKGLSSDFKSNCPV